MAVINSSLVVVDAIGCLASVVVFGDVKDEDPELFVLEWIYRAAKDKPNADFLVVFDSSRITSGKSALNKASRNLQVKLEEVGIQYSCDSLDAIMSNRPSDDWKGVVISPSQSLVRYITPGSELRLASTSQTVDYDYVQSSLNVGDLALFFALVGDKYADIPGISGFGVSNAIKWMNKYSDLHGMKQAAQRGKGALACNLKKSIKSLEQTHDRLTSGIEECSPKEILSAQPVFMTKLVSLLVSSGRVHQEIAEGVAVDSRLVLIASNEGINKLTSVIEQQTVAFVDIIGETEPLCLLVSFSCEDVYALPLVGRHAVGRDVLRPVLNAMARKQLRKVTAEAKLLQKKWKIAFGERISLFGDIKTLAYAQNTSTAKLGVEDLGSIKSGVLIPKEVEHSVVTLKLSEPVSTLKNAIEPYGSRIQGMKKLFKHLFDSSKVDRRLTAFYQNVELPLATVLAQMEDNGVLIDVSVFEALTQQVSEELQDLEAKVFDVAGVIFNIQSPTEVAKVLYTKMSLPRSKGNSTNEAALKELKAQGHAIAGDILKVRALSKLKSSYLESLPRKVSRVSGRVHGQFNQIVTATGRLSSSDPNLQNIPIRTAVGRKIRNAFIARSGYKIIAPDYSQIELRILAHASREPVLINAFKEGIDIHKATAAEVFDVPLEDVTDEQRRAAKSINFGIIYGMSPFGLAQKMGVTVATAETYINKYFARLPMVSKYLAHLREYGWEKGYVKTLSGRKIHVKEGKSKSRLNRGSVERASQNAPMQGTASDIIKKAMVEIAHWADEMNVGLILLMQVHDELVFEVEERFADEISNKVVSIMENIVQLAVPLKVEAVIGDSWGAAH